MKLADNTCSEFVHKLSSKLPTPGGGGAAALVGSIGTALASMAANLTANNKKFSEYEKDIKYIAESAQKIQDELLSLIDEDAEHFLPFIKAFDMPKETEEEKKSRQEVIQKCLKDACVTPIKIIKKCCEALEIHEYMVNHCSKMVASDIGVGVQSLRSAILSGELNVIININSIKDDEYVSKVKKEVGSLVKSGTEKADMIYKKVLNTISK
ncbi:cyclodeaminase/cyclohydrolase family protein [Clostridium sp. JN-1]|uniref:cyclodeaminase/cyclohydrolase family protein n=1 Tax=Clostridium sp. JN-1 TaxID=2483110 RepID=UPI000F0BB988|nr:cyclodeaminase/cyclohydrolase family protein [Clostridium sp. JN-1]